MKQTVFLIALEAIAVLGVFVRGPFPAVVVYYVLAVLRPQYFWKWALPRDIAWSDYPAAAAIAGLIVYSFGLLPIGGRREGNALGFSATHVAFLAFGLWVCLTYFTAQSQLAAWPWLLEYLTIFTMFFIATIVIRTVDQIWILYLCTTIPLLYIAYELNSLYILDGRLDIYHVGLGGLDNNGAGLMLAMSVPLALNAWEAMRSIWRWFFVASIPLVLHAVLMSYSRGAMVSLIAIVPFLAWRSQRKWQFLGVLALLMLTVPYMAGNEIRERFFTIEDYADDRAAQQRFDSWESAFAIASDYPIFGAGIRNANLLSYRYGADMEGRTIHSQFLQIMADEGYVGLFLYLVTLACFFFTGWRTRRRLRARGDPDARRMIAIVNGAESSLAVFCVGALFLSLEVFELPYLVILIGAQTAMVAKASAFGQARAVGGASRVNVPSTPHLAQRVS